MIMALITHNSYCYRNNGSIRGQSVNVSRQTTPLRLPSLERKEFAKADNFAYTNESLVSRMSYVLLAKKMADCHLSQKYLLL